MSWRLATSLGGLLREFNEAYPGRSKSSDGTIGDPDHASRCSRHNPNQDDVVTALDVTHDPEHGLDIHAEARKIVRLQRAGKSNPDLEYVVSNFQTASRSQDWIWRPYTGSNPHTKHAHFAVGRGSDCDPRPPYDSTAPWGITGGIWMPDAVVLVHPSAGTPDALAGLLGLYMRPDLDVMLTCNPNSAKEALAAGKRVYAIGGKAAALIDGDEDLRGASRIETAEKVIAQAREGW